RRPRCRKIARRHNAEAGGRGTAFVSLYGPCVCLAVEDCLFDPGVELDVTPEVEAISHMIEVTQDLRLRAITLGPMPLLLQFVGEGIRVLHASDIAATPRVAVPIPGAANAAASLEGTHFEAQLTQAMDRVETADPCPDDDRVESRGF